MKQQKKIKYFPRVKSTSHKKLKHKTKYLQIFFTNLGFLMTYAHGKITSPRGTSRPFRDQANLALLECAPQLPRGGWWGQMTKHRLLEPPHPDPREADSEGLGGRRPGLVNVISSLKGFWWASNLGSSGRVSVFTVVSQIWIPHSATCWPFFCSLCRTYTVSVNYSGTWQSSFTVTNEIILSRSNLRINISE